MKKFLTILAVFAMLLSMLAVGVSAEQTCQEVTIPRFSAKPTFDGIVSVEEWGEPTVHMVTDGAATVEDETIGENAEYGLKNIFYWFSYEDEEMNDNFEYDLWLRWDEEFFYIAAVVEDPNPFSLPNGGSDIWCGDVLQFVVDVAGPSAVMLKHKEDFNYKTDEFLGARFNTPWSSDSVFNGFLGLVKGKTPTALRASGDWNMATEAGAMVGITTVPHEETLTCTTMYEGAIPWSVIAAEGTDVADINTEFVPKAGDVYGVAAVVCCSDSNVLTAWLQWGHGICSAESGSSQPRGTRGGSQAMILGADEIAPAAEYETAPETTETEEETETEILAPDVTGTATDGTAEPADSTAESDDGTDEATGDESSETTTAKTPSSDKKDEGGALPTGALIAIIAGVAVVIVVVVIVIKKRK